MPRTTLQPSPPPAALPVQQDGMVERVVDVTQALLRTMGIEAKVFCRDRRADESPHLWVEILCQESGLLIGERGSTLQAFEHVLRRCVWPLTGDAVRVVADVNAYRVRRIDIVRRLARAAAQRARRTGHAVIMESMRPFDRRVVHLTLAAEDGIATESVGEEPSRRVVVRPVTAVV